jgi:nucleotide-binding universal stress UspA family protein
VPLGATAYKRERDEIRLTEAHRRILDFLERFRAHCDAVGVPCAIVEDIGTPHQQIVLEAAACDVVVLSQRTNFHFETQDRPDHTISEVLRLSPRPMIVVPGDDSGGAGVLVAYGGGREVARTLQTFTLLGLAGGETVHVVAIDPHTAEAERRLRRAGEYLAAHAISHELHPVGTDAPPARVILEEIRRRQPRLLVMGGPGHHRVRDVFVTSVTRAVLQETPVPVFTGA